MTQIHGEPDSRFTAQRHEGRGLKQHRLRKRCHAYVLTWVFSTDLPKAFINDRRHQTA